ncbi:MAG: hypothetical protein K8F59_02550 [Rhodobacteraceae bacterium]|nr:hypothetical protein [Paracoccaceae bacterium]
MALTFEPGTDARKTSRQMTRAQMQTEALIIESLLNAVMTLFAGDNAQDSITLIEMACERAEKLNCALDSVNWREVGA